MYRYSVATVARTEMVEITSRVQEAVSQSGVKDGLATVFVPHTTAAVTINEAADPSVTRDILQGLEKIVPYRAAYYQHREGNSDAHLKSSLLGSSVNVPVEGGHLVLGTWQGIFFCEFDGPRQRQFYVLVAGESPR